MSVMYDIVYRASHTVCTLAIQKWIPVDTMQRAEVLGEFLEKQGNKYGRKTKITKEGAYPIVCNNHMPHVRVQ